MKKIRETEEWANLALTISRCMECAGISFSVEYAKEISAFDSIYSPNLMATAVEYKAARAFTPWMCRYRVMEVVTACADDLHRYCSYHEDVQVILGDRGRMFDVAKVDLATFLLKWIMNFRPILIDLSRNESDRSHKAGKKNNFRRCNEHFSIFALAHVADIDTAGKTIKSVTDKVGEGVIEELLTTLRYRAKHQDAFKGWVSRFFQ